MARYTGPSCKLCRREGCALYLKGERCLSEKCAVARRSTAPGQSGTGRRSKPSEYNVQLREKQKARRYYGVLEKQFHNYYVEADRKEGTAGDNLLITLERRLDNTVYRMGMASSRKEARQLVLHAHFTVNGKKVNIPSIIVRAGDVIAPAEASRSSVKIKELIENLEGVTPPKWLELDKEKATAKVVMLPTREDVDFPFDEQLIIELYSK